jgi:hypothetical protein
MSTKKIIIIVGIIVVVLGLLIVTFVGGIVGVAFYSIANSEAAEVAKDFLRKNERLKQDIGEVKDFGFFVTGSISRDQSEGAATLNFRVDGERKTVNASVQLAAQRGQWRVTQASYENDAGQTVELLNVYETRHVYLLSFAVQ